MLLSAAGSTSSGTSSMAGRSHRRSFAPSIDGNKVRSLSAALNPNSRLHAPHKIKTIAEDDVIDSISKSKSLHAIKSSPNLKLNALEECDDETVPSLDEHKRGGSQSLNL